MAMKPRSISLAERRKKKAASVRPTTNPPPSTIRIQLWGMERVSASFRHPISRLAFDLSFRALRSRTVPHPLFGVTCRLRYRALNSPLFYPILTAVVLALLPGRDTVPLFGGIVKRRSSFDSSSRGLVSLSRRNDVRCLYFQQYPNHDDAPAQVSPKPMCVCIGQGVIKEAAKYTPLAAPTSKLLSWLLASTFCVNQHYNQQARSIVTRSNLGHNAEQKPRSTE